MKLKLKFYLILSFFIVSLFSLTKTTMVNAFSCEFTCTKYHCKGGKAKWDECFKNCWRTEGSRISHCTEAARKAGNVDKLQESIMTNFQNSMSAFSCDEKCNRLKCGSGKGNWDECFKGCWKDHEAKITHCTDAARKAGNIDDTQKAIIDFFSGK
jgi:hypothetical protein